MNSSGLALISTIIVFLKEMLKMVISLRNKHDQVKSIKQASRSSGYKKLVRALKARRKAVAEFNHRLAAGGRPVGMYHKPETKQ